MIQLLDMSEWHWTPQEILEMPEAWADDLILARSCGWIVKEQSKNQRAA